MTAPERFRLARERLSRELRRLRSDAELTGTAAARAAGMSQSKLSKIENGMLLPSVADVERLVVELGAAEEVRAELVALAKALHTETDSRRVVLHRGAHRHQQAVGRIEAKATASRFFLLNLVPALLRSEAYQRAVLALVSEDEREAAVAALAARRSVLDDPGKQFVFLLAEGALRWRLGSAQLMREQVEHIAGHLDRPNVRIGVVPWAAGADAVVLHGFHIYDERVVTVSLHTGSATITDPVDVREYLNLFEKLACRAVYGDQLRELLAGIAADYASLVRTDLVPPGPA
ncbi:DUF5753 domain-containing protein [Goodfellowiella coeruleoviolacea]|uniref:Helix-turn-helix domain-containing protein n=1 Tax=Goodfellowiella coeruleoviolacea TaxID=334858 RepID=A0AAE3GE85_9PSEU|nr:DUF5753 domain-containing protein [Goodfellowiella coeruleoviolacea]MCP2166606.1 Helix-turn-helix domain-containing protein [Goodfellowiella coeruleoviolacea]